VDATGGSIKAGRERISRCRSISTETNTTGTFEGYQLSFGFAFEMTNDVSKRPWERSGRLQPRGKVDFLHPNFSRTITNAYRNEGDAAFRRHQLSRWNRKT